MNERSSNLYSGLAIFTAGAGEAILAAQLASETQVHGSHIAYGVAVCAGLVAGGIGAARAVNAANGENARDPEASTSWHRDHGTLERLGAATTLLAATNLAHAEVAYEGHDADASTYFKLAAVGGLIAAVSFFRRGTTRN